MGICHNANKHKQIKAQSYLSATPSKCHPNFIVGNLKVDEQEQPLEFHYLIQFQSISGSNQEHFRKTLALALERQLALNPKGLLGCNESHLSDHFTRLLYIDDLENIKDYQISINLIFRMKGKIYNVNVGSMKCLVFTVCDTGKLVITELVQPHILGRADEAKRVIRKLQNNQNQTEYPFNNNNINKKANAQLKKIKITEDNDQYFQVTRSLGFGKTKRTRYGIISCAEVNAVDLSSGIKMIGIFSESILRVLNSFEIAYFVNEKMKNHDLSTFSTELINYAKSLWKKSASFIKTSIEGSSRQNLSIPVVFPKKERTADESQCFCLTIFL